MKKTKSLFKSNFRKKTYSHFMGWFITFSTISLFSVGFSSWRVGLPDSQTDSFDATAANINYQQENFQGAAYFVKNSEKWNDTYSFDGNVMYATTEFSCQIKINPKLLKQYFSSNKKNLIIGLTCVTSNNFKPFENTSVTIPESIECYSVNYENRMIYSSDKTVYSKTSDNGLIDNKLLYSFNLYDDTDLSLYTITYDLQTNNEFIFLNLTIPFKIDDAIIEQYKTVEFKFVTNLEELQ